MFRIRLNIAESKRAELAISATNKTTECSRKKFGFVKLEQPTDELLSKM